MMRTLVVFPPGDMDRPDLERAVAASLNRFDVHGEVLLAADALWRPQVAAAFPDKIIQSWPVEDGSILESLGALVFVESMREESHLSDWRQQDGFPHGRRIYRLHMGTRIKLLEPSVYDAFEYTAVDAHVFNRLSRKKNGYSYLPYGPNLSDVELGHVNEFGFRVPDDYMALADRPSNHKVIAVFGGSSAFSFYCFDHETFSAVLERMLNERAAATGSELTFTVLNFGMHDNVVMQEMINYGVFVAPVHPDMVIAHDGHNDMYYGLQNDPHLLNRSGIIYQRLHQDWAKLVQGSEAVKTPDLYSVSTECLQMNIPDNVIDVYIARKTQFMRTAQAFGAHFVWGVQPIHASKGALSQREIRKQEAAGLDTSPHRRRWMRCFNQIYDMLSARLTRLEDIHLLDFHRRFAAFDDSVELFWDNCHLSPAGDAVVARAYADEVAPLLGLDWVGPERAS
jgi:hypothetical protein